jgi:hypothetical protein
VETIKRPHFFAQPVDVPLIFWKEDAFGLTGYGTTQIHYSQTGGSAPDAAEFFNAGYVHDKLIFVLESERIK